MPYIAGTGVPTRVRATCPRCHALRHFTAISSPLSYRCSGCDWLMTFGAGSPTLNTSASTTTASTALTFASGGTAYLVKNIIFISDGASSEIVEVSGTTSATTVPVAGFAFSHGSAVATSLAVASPTLTNQDKVPIAPGWGF